MKKTKKKLDAGSIHYLKILGIILAAITFYAIINNLGKVGDAISTVLDIISPITIGLCIAFVLNLPLKFFENFVFKRLTAKNGKVWSKLKRPVCLTLSIVSILAVLSILLAVVIPQFVSACTDFLFALPTKMAELNAWISGITAQFNLPFDITSITIDWEWVSAQILSYLSRDFTSITSNAINIAVSVFNGIINVVLGFVFSIYILASKESLGKLAKSLLYAVIDKDKARHVISTVVLSNKAFTGFVSGQCIEVALIGILCFIGMLIFGFEYPLMISCIIALTAFVPVFGGIAGAIIGAVLILISESFIKAVLFLVFILVLQQIESNALYPRIMGKQVGLPSIWVLVAVTIGGGMFGVFGIIVSVPICSVAYTLFQRWIIKRLEERNICHRSMSHDSSEPRKLVEGIEDLEFEPGFDIVPEDVAPEAAPVKEEADKTADGDNTTAAASNDDTQKSN